MGIGDFMNRYRTSHHLRGRLLTLIVACYSFNSFAMPPKKEAFKLISHPRQFSPSKDRTSRELHNLRHMVRDDVFAYLGQNNIQSLLTYLLETLLRMSPAEAQQTALAFNQEFQIIHGHHMIGTSGTEDEGVAIGDEDDGAEEPELVAMTTIQPRSGMTSLSKARERSATIHAGCYGTFDRRPSSIHVDRSVSALDAKPRNFLRRSASSLAKSASSLVRSTSSSLNTLVELITSRMSPQHSTAASRFIMTLARALVGSDGHNSQDQLMARFVLRLLPIIYSKNGNLNWALLYAELQGFLADGEENFSEIKFAKMHRRSEGGDKDEDGSGGTGSACLSFQAPPVSF